MAINGTLISSGKQTRARAGAAALRQLRHAEAMKVDADRQAMYRLSDCKAEMNDSFVVSSATHIYEKAGGISTLIEFTSTSDGEDFATDPDDAFVPFGQGGIGHPA